MNGSKQIDVKFIDESWRTKTWGTDIYYDCQVQMYKQRNCAHNFDITDTSNTT